MVIKYDLKEANKDFSYPPIPRWDKDDTLLDDKDPSPPKVKIRDVEVTLSTEWGTGDAAASRALQATETTEKNEQLVRTYHPALRDKQSVSASESRYGPPIWLVRDRATRVEAGGRAIHNYPVDHWEFWHSMTFPCVARKEDLLFRLPINPRKLLRPTQLDNLREVFPRAVGVRVLVSGHMVVLFKSRADMKDVYSCWTTWILGIGGLYTFYEVASADLTARMRKSGGDISIHSNSPDWRSGLGLRLVMPDGTEVMTSVTHDTVFTPSPSFIPRTLQNWMRSARNAILRLCNQPCPLPDSPVGREVIMSPDSKPIGTVIHTYDNPSQTHPYPAGYTHDLSLVAGEKLPTIASTVGGPRITGWASYTEALSGAPAFTMCLNTPDANENILQSHPSPPDLQREDMQRATVVGTQYLWDRGTRSQSAALLWRTEDESTPEIGWPGSVLCVGRPEDEAAKAVVFHNYRTRYLVDGNKKGKCEYGFLNAGFLLPEEVRAARIV